MSDGYNTKLRTLGSNSYSDSVSVHSLFPQWEGLCTGGQAGTGREAELGLGLEGHLSLLAPETSEYGRLVFKKRVLRVYKTCP